MMEVMGAVRVRGHGRRRPAPLQLAVEDGRVLLRVGTEDTWAEAPTQVVREYAEPLLSACNQVEAQ